MVSSHLSDFPRIISARQRQVLLSPGDDMELHRCVAAYMSDLTMISTALSGFQGFRTNMAASLDHAMWFHTPFRADEFMLYECRSTRTSTQRSDATLPCSYFSQSLKK